jgi:hypothetical protein
MSKNGQRIALGRYPVPGNFYGTSRAKMGTITTSPANLLIDDYLSFGHNLYPPGVVL